MFDTGIGWSELLVVGVIAIIVVGPKDLPVLMRSIGGALTKIKKMGDQFRTEVEGALKEGELGDLRATLDDVKNDITSSKTVKELQDELDDFETLKAQTWDDVAYDQSDGSDPFGGSEFLDDDGGYDEEPEILDEKLKPPSQNAANKKKRNAS